MRWQGEAWPQVLVRDKWKPRLAPMPAVTFVYVPLIGWLAKVGKA